MKFEQLSVFEIFISDEKVYIVEEYAREESLEKLVQKFALEQAKLSEEVIRMLVEPIFKGIASLHSKNIVYKYVLRIFKTLSL